MRYNQTAARLGFDTAVGIGRAGEPARQGVAVTVTPAAARLIGMITLLPENKGSHHVLPRQTALSHSEFPLPDHTPVPCLVPQCAGQQYWATSCWKLPGGDAAPDNLQTLTRAGGG